MRTSHLALILVHFKAHSTPITPQNTCNTLSLDELFVGDGGHEDGFIVEGGDGVSSTGTSWLTLKDDLLASSLGYLASSVVFLDTAQEISTALRGLDVFNADIDALLHVTVTDTLVDNQTESTGTDVVNDGSAAMVELVRHTLVDGTVSLNVDQVSNLVSYHVSG